MPREALKGVPCVQAALGGTFGGYGSWFIAGATLLLCKPVLPALKDYQRQKDDGEDPAFRPAKIGLEGETEFWR